MSELPVSTMSPHLSLLDWPVRGSLPCGPAEPLWNQTEGTPLRRVLSGKPSKLEMFVAEGNSLAGIGIRAGDIMIVDLSIEPQPGDVGVFRSAASGLFAKLVGDGQLLACYSARKLEPIALLEDTFALGKVISLVKSMEDVLRGVGK